ncbi:DNA repair exonuclease [Thermosphaera chiliense]|uniref:DNA double-strand break repair protein Mre11 n=1 Tax=Thermosphaera chiliense TaxID=3402707 RepID=A0A7M1UTU7_9CREN|nr:DNA repair exonuclease [Thermosphaera aggregans]QOR94692.1 DNA repair exonuclease [Thermosphaera aggregans]
MLVAHFADTHLGKTLYNISETMRQFIDHFEQAVEQALKEHVDAFIFAGDFFDDKHHLPNRVLKRAIDIVGRITSEGKPVFIVPGDHDRWPQRDDSPIELLRLFSNVYTPGKEIFFAEKALKDGREYVFAGLNYFNVKNSEQSRQALYKYIQGMDRALGKYDVLIMHQNIENYFPLEKGLSISNIPVTPRYVAMGHLHRRIIEKRVIDGRSQVIAYPGSIDIFDIDEVEEARRNGKGFYIVDLTPEEPVVHTVKVEATPFEYVETGVAESEWKPKIAEALARLAKQVNPGNKGILYVKIFVKAGDMVSLERIEGFIVDEKKRRLQGGLELIFHKFVRELVKETFEKASRITQQARGELDTLADFLARELGISPDEAKKLAEHVEGLKEAFKQGDEEAVEQIIEELARATFWSRIGIPDEYVKLEEAKPGRVSEPSAHKPSRITDYFKR